MSIVIDNHKSYVFIIFKFKPTFEENQLHFLYDNFEVQKKGFECEKNENYLIKIFYFQRVPTCRKFCVKYKTIKQELDNSVNFIFNIPILSYSQLELSDYEKFGFYHNFINEMNSDSLIELFYTNCALIFGNKVVNLQIALELLEHYKNNKKRNDIIY